MLAELAAANAAFAVIKQAISNGKEIADCTKAISSFVNAKESLRKKSVGRKRHDLEEFMALEKIRRQEEELKEYMIYAGRPGLWYDWVRFQANARKERLAEIERRKKRKAKIIEIILLSILLVMLGLVIMFFIWLGLEYYRRA